MKSESGYAIDFHTSKYRRTTARRKAGYEREELGTFYCGSMTKAQTEELMGMVQYYCREGKKHCGTVPTAELRVTHVSGAHFSLTQLLRAAVEFGYKACERGDNIQTALAKFDLL